MRVEQTSAFLGEVLKDVAAGRLAPASFQRPYVWDREDVEAMFSSILRGYPLGALVTWVPATAQGSVPSRGRLGPIPTPPGEYQFGSGIILDGQNRLASLAWATSDGLPDSISVEELSEAERRVWLSGETLCADLDERAIRFFPSSEARTARRVPVAGLVRYPHASQTARAMERDFGRIADADLDWLGDTVPSAFSAARIQVTTLLRATAAEARDAFLHMCRVGKPMDPAHLEAALGWESEGAGTPSP